MKLQNRLMLLGAIAGGCASSSVASAQEAGPPSAPRSSVTTQFQPGTLRSAADSSGLPPVMRMLEPQSFEALPVPPQNATGPEPPSAISNPNGAAPWSRDLAGERGLPAPSLRESPIVDSALQPAAYQQMENNVPPRQIAAAGADAALAQSLLTELQRSSQQVLSGFQPMGLDDMLANCESWRHKEMVQQYWTAWHACTEYLFAADESRWLAQLVQPRDESERLVLEAARATVADALLEKEIAMRRQLEKLNQFLAGPASETLPWPTDLPMVGNYKTYYALYASQGFASGKLRSIDQWLPLQQELIVNRAATVQRCRSAIQRSTQVFNQTGGGSATMLQALYLSRESHGAFSRCVAQYNREIAEYALTLKPSEPTTEKVVAMLIPQAPARSMVPGDSLLRQAAVPQDATYRPGRTAEYGGPGGGGTTLSPGIRAGEFNGGQPAFQPEANPAVPSTFRR
jgi:hypothetical protein